MPLHPRQRLAALLAALSIVVAACVGAASSAPIPTMPPPTPTPSVTPAPSGSSEASAAPGTSPSASGSPAGSSVPIPSTPVGSRFAWVMQQVNAGGAGLTTDAVSGAFDSSFLTQVPAASLVNSFQTIGNSGPYTVTSFTPDSDVQAVQRLNEAYRMITEQLGRVIVGQRQVI